MAHAPPITDVQTDVHIVPVDCDLTVHNLLILPTPCVVMVHGLGIYSLSGAPFLHLNRPDTFVFRLSTQSAVAQMVVQWRTERFRTSTPNVVCSIFKNVFQQTSNIDTEDRSSVSRCGPKTPSKQTD